MNLNAHEHVGPTWWENDGYGIPLCKVCETCVDAKLAKYRPDIFTHYDADEPIEPEPVPGGDPDPDGWREYDPPEPFEVEEDAF